MREVPDGVRRLPDQYFTALLGRVAAAALAGGEPLVDLGRGNPEVGPPEHVVRALTECARRDNVHGYAPFSGLPALKEAIAIRYRVSASSCAFRACTSVFWASTTSRAVDSPAW